MSENVTAGAYIAAERKVGTWRVVRPTSCARDHFNSRPFSGHPGPLFENSEFIRLLFLQFLNNPLQGVAGLSVRWNRSRGVRMRGKRVLISCLVTTFDGTPGTGLLR